MQGKYTGEMLEQTLDDSKNHIADKNNPHKVTPAHLGLHAVATSGSYNDLKDKPAPQDISGKADKTEVQAIQTALDNLGLTVQNGMLCAVFNK